MGLFTRVRRLLSGGRQPSRSSDTSADPPPAAGAPAGGVPAAGVPAARELNPSASADGTIGFDYAPRRDGRPDPGEIVWAWVPYDEGDGRGKDRPVLIISRGRDEQGRDELHGLTLTSKDHDRDAADEARWGRYWMDIGTGPWDSRGRPSEVRLDRILRLPVGSVRREGAALDQPMFLRVAQETQRVQARKQRR